NFLAMLFDNITFLIVNISIVSQLESLRCLKNSICRFNKSIVAYSIKLNAIDKCYFSIIQCNDCLSLFEQTLSILNISQNNFTILIVKICIMQQFKRLTH